MNRNDAKHSHTMAQFSLKGSGQNLQKTKRCKRPVFTATKEQIQKRSSLIKSMLKLENLMKAYHQAVQNISASSSNGVSIENRNKHLLQLQDNMLKVQNNLPLVVLAEVPTAGEESRTLGIPTLIDRLLQQALQQVLRPLFAESSSCFKSKKSTEQAFQQLSLNAVEEKRKAFHLDLEKFFDRINHDLLMTRLALCTKDKRILLLVHRYLQASSMNNRFETIREEGSSQKGPLPLLLPNGVHGNVGEELEKRGHTFCRYTIDCKLPRVGY